MKRTFAASLVFAALAVAVIGAGCASSPAPSSQSQPEPQPAAGSPTEQAAAAFNAQQSMTETSTYAFPGVLPKEETSVNVRIKTAKGDIVLQLLPDEGPNAASNFVYLIKNKFYDGLIFHRVVPSFVIQGGDPQGTGTGGPGYRFADDPVPSTSAQVTNGDFQGQSVTIYKQGTLAMANAGPNTNGSQFFIMLEDQPLDPNYSVFGKVIEGQDVVAKIAIGDVMESVTIESRE